MCQNAKKGYNNNCHNNCRIHHHPNFFSYYYPAFPQYPCATVSLVQYSMPSQSTPPLFLSSQYSPIIQQSGIEPQPSQGFIQGQYYPYPLNNANFQPQSFQNEYDLPRYNVRPGLAAGQSYNNDFRQSISSLNAEDEYNWEVHISDVLDEFISRNHNRPKSSYDEYQKLRQKLDTSLRHLKEAEILNKTLINNWEKNNAKTLIDRLEQPSLRKNNPEIKQINNNSNNNDHLLSKNDNDLLLKPQDYKMNVTNYKKIVPITKNVLPQKNITINENKNKETTNFSDFVDESNDSSHNVVFNNNEIMASNLSAKTVEDKAKKDNNVKTVVAEELDDFLGTNAPQIDLPENNFELIEYNNENEGTKFIDINKVKDTKPVAGTYKDYLIKTPLGKIQASEIYPKIFDEYGHLKMDHYEAMAHFGLTEQQYDTLVDNFYKLNEKSSEKNKFGIVVKTKFNAKAFWIAMTILGIILFLIGITVILYFTVPSITTEINNIIDKIKKMF